MQLAEQMVSLLAVFGLLAMAVWALGKKSGRSWFAFRRQPSAKASMLLVERLVLTPHHVLHLIRIGERASLVATHSHGVTFEPAGSHFQNEFRNAMVSAHEESK